jgi:hypothetical protein
VKRCVAHAPEIDTPRGVDEVRYDEKALRAEGFDPI